MTSEVRKRPGKGASTNGDAKTPSKQSATKPPTSSGLPFSILDVLRAIVGLALISTLASYLTTKGESYVWGVQRPWWTKPERIQEYFRKPIYLTLEELAKFDGSSPETPIYLAINRTIYDVSASPKVYGPGGYYSKLAAKDASRSFITTCFDPKEDLVPWLGGVEEIYVPVWLSKGDVDKEISAMAGGDSEREITSGMGMRQMVNEIKRRIGRKKILKLQEEAYVEAKDRVKQQIDTWENMFKKKEYPIIGKVIGVNETDETQWNKLGFCEAAKKQRPSIGASIEKALEMAGMAGNKMNIGQMRGSGAKKEKDDDEERKDNKKRLVAENKKKKAGKAGAKDDDSALPDAIKGMPDEVKKGSKFKKAKEAAQKVSGDSKANEDVESAYADENWDALKKGVDADDPVRGMSYEELMSGKYSLKQKKKKQEEEAAKKAKAEGKEEWNEEELNRVIQDQAADL